MRPRWTEPDSTEYKAGERMLALPGPHFSSALGPDWFTRQIEIASGHLDEAVKIAVVGEEPTFDKLSERKAGGYVAAASATPSACGLHVRMAFDANLRQNEVAGFLNWYAAELKQRAIYTWLRIDGSEHAPGGPTTRVSRLGADLMLARAFLGMGGGILAVIGQWHLYGYRLSPGIIELQGVMP